MKKKVILCACLTVLAFTLCSCAKTANTAPNDAASDEALLGGWEIASHEAEALPQDAQAAFDKVQGSLDDGAYAPVALMGSQVVAGMNYCILCQVTPKDSSQPKWSLVYIYADLQGNAEVTNVYDLYIAAHSTPAE